VTGHVEGDKGMSNRIRVVAVALAAAVTVAGAAYAQTAQNTPGAPAPGQGMMGRQGEMMMGQDGMKEMMEAHTRMVETCTEMMRTAMHQGGQPNQTPNQDR
jgi:surface antigen